MAQKKQPTKAATQAETAKKSVAKKTADKTQSESAQATKPAAQKKSKPTAEIGDTVQLHGIQSEAIEAQMIDKTEDNRATLVYHDESGAPQHIDNVSHESNTSGATFWK